jgi:hypothetical protein
VKIPDPLRAGAFERLCRRLIMVRGWFVILYNQLRRRMGLSYYPSTDPWVAGLLERSYQRSEFIRSLELQAWHAGEWMVAGEVACESGRLVLTDPIEFPTTNPPNGVVVSDVPIGTHPIELQQVRLGRGYGRRVMRARILWGQISDSDFHYLGAVGVDLAAMSIADVDQTSRSTPEQVAASGFDPMTLLGGGESYAAIDPVACGRFFLHVFETGLGDGCYPVLRIDCGGRSSGILIDMTKTLDVSELKAAEEAGTELPQSATSRHEPIAGRIYSFRRFAR